MRKPKSKPLFEYLQQTEAWKSGDKALIETEIKNYRKQYLTEKKRASRKENKHVTIILKDSEIITLEGSAKEHGMKLPQYIKQSALHYHAGQFLVPNAADILKIKEILYTQYRQIEDIRKYEQRKWFGNINQYEKLQAIIQEQILQTENLYSNPKLLIECIQERLAQDGDFIQTLQTLIQDYGIQKPL